MIEIGIIETIQKISNPVFDFIFQMITFIGDEYFFIALAVVIYWTIDKKFGYKFIFAFLGSAFINQGLKSIIKRPRPYTLDGVKSIGEMESGYSFPSGHSQATAVIATSLFTKYNKEYKWIKYVLLSLLILVPFSRVYLGQHFPTDVLAGIAIGICATLLMFKIFDLMGDNEDKWPLIIALLGIIFIIVDLIFIHGSYDEFDKIYAAVGGFTGFSVGYYLEKKYVGYNVNNKLTKHIVKLLIGGLVAVGILVVLKLIPNDYLLLDLLFFFIIALWASFGAPLVFSKIKYLQ